ncbi:MAG: hypothetical protein ACTH9H_12970 [Galactobacter sp.]
MELAVELKHPLDGWQANAVHSWLRRGRDGLWCSSTWGLSAPRQNGKNGGLEIVEVYLTAALGLKILHTAHHLGTARKAFKRLLSYFGQQVSDPNARFPWLNAMVVEIRKTNGQEAIYLSNGACIEVGARTSGAGRGSSFDVLVVDEAQEYEEDEQEALEATVSASPSGDPVIIYTGTPPANLSERGAPFVRVRNAAVTGQDKRSAWVEHSARGDVDKMTETQLVSFVADRSNWFDANPALGIRILERTVEGESKRLSPRSFARERLNMWPTPREAVREALKTEKWSALQLGEDEMLDPDAQVAAYGIDMNPERTQVTIGAAVFSEDDRMHLELAVDTAFSTDGTSALVQWVWERAGRRVPVVLDTFSPARDVLEVALKKKGMKVYVLGGSEFTQACAMLRQAVERDKSVTHIGQEQLDVSIEHAKSEPLKKFPGSFKWARESIEVSLTPLMAITYAYYGAMKFAKRIDPDKQKKRHAMAV